MRWRQCRSNGTSAIRHFKHFETIFIVTQSRENRFKDVRESWLGKENVLNYNGVQMSTWSGVNVPAWRTTSTSRHWRQTMTTFCLINVSERSTYSSVHCRRQSVSCYSRSSVEQSSIARHSCPPVSPSSAVVLNHISSHFLIPLSDSSLICTVSAQWLVILDTIVGITFNIYWSFIDYREYVTVLGIERRERTWPCGLTLNDICADSDCLSDALNDVLREWKHWNIVVHVNEIHYQLQQQNQHQHHHHHHHSISSNQSMYKERRNRVIIRGSRD